MITKQNIAATALLILFAAIVILLAFGAMRLATSRYGLAQHPAIVQVVGPGPVATPAISCRGRHPLNWRTACMYNGAGPRYAPPPHFVPAPGHEAWRVRRRRR